MRLRCFWIAVVLAVLTLPSVGRASDCYSTVRLDEGEFDITLDTRTASNNLNDACADSLATGPEIIIDFGGGAYGGTVTWVADFDAVVYHRRDRCDGPCAASSTSGRLEFSSGWHWDYSQDQAVWSPPYLVVDGIDGAAGTITLSFFVTTANPTNEASWGQVKSLYRP